MHQITVTYPSGEKSAFPFGIRISNILQGFGALRMPLAAVTVNNELMSLDSILVANCKVEPVYIDTTQGAFAYRRSLCFIAAIAAKQLFPERKLIVGQSLGYSFYHYFENGAASDEDIEKLEKAMRELIERDIPITTEFWSYEEAVGYFTEQRQSETLMLLEMINDSFITLNDCAGFRDLQTSPLVPSSGILKTFGLMKYGSGFLLRYPKKETPDKLEPFKDDPLLYKITEDSRKRSQILGITSVGSLNRINAPKKIKEYIQVAETLMNKHIAEVADKIAQRSNTVKVVLIAGPSSSGKTTTSKKLAIQLKVLGFDPIVISLDDYFVNRDKTPLDENGQPDFECLEALDVAYLNEQLLDLFAGKAVELPSYEFKTGSRKPSGKIIKMTGKEILIMEGIHGLNDKLTPKIPKEHKVKIYVSALTQINLDAHNRISTTDNRLIRRIVRDNQFRGHSAQKTISMWPSVQRGERLHIFPFQNNADIALNTALDYELGVLKVYVEPVLRLIKPQDVEYSEAKRILNFLEFFAPIPAQYVPDDSLVREFIGESSFKY